MNYLEALEMEERKKALAGRIAEWLSDPGFYRTVQFDHNAAPQREYGCTLTEEDFREQFPHPITASARGSSMEAAFSLALAGLRYKVSAGERPAQP